MANTRCINCDEELDECVCEIEHDCGFCGATCDEEHALNCPENDSPFANLIRDGYD